MPTYDFKCNACGHAFEAVQTMSAAPLKKCPKCGKPKLERLIGMGAAVLFKGSGFYETDYRSQSYKKGADSESKPASESKTETKSDTKASTGDVAAKPVSKPVESKPAKDSAKPRKKAPGDE